MKHSVMLLFLSLNAFAQTFSGEIGDVFMGNEKNTFAGNIKIISGVIKKNDMIEIYAETDRKFTAKITKLEADDVKDVASAKAGQYIFADFITLEDALSGKDYLRKGYKFYPKGFQINTTAMKAEVELKKKIDFKATLDSKPFRGAITYKGATFWRKGVKNLVEKPYLQIQFKSVDVPDDRNLTIQIFYPKENIAKYGVKDMEVNFSGAMDGKKENTTMYGFINGKADTDFTLEIMKWQVVSNTKAIISGKINGELREIAVLGKAKKRNKFENGVFENVEVEIFNELYDMKKMMEGKY